MENKNIYSAKNLYDYLIKESEKHKYFHHYTTLPVLKCIFKNRTFKMRRGNSTNLDDWHEWKAKGVECDWERTYISCFSYGDYENIGMWGLYGGLPTNQAVRLSLPKEAMNFVYRLNQELSNSELSNKKCNVYKDENKIHSFYYNDIESVYISDVFYAKDKGNQTFKSKRINFKKSDETIIKDIRDFLKKKELTGCVKNYAWHFENEVRIIIKFKNMQFDKKGNCLDCVYIEFPEDILNLFHIMTGPNFDKYLDLETIVGKNYINSQFNDLVHFKFENISQKINSEEANQ